MATQFRDQAAGSMRAALGLAGIGRVCGVEFVLEIAIAKAVDGELPGKQGFEESDILRRDRVEGGDMLTGFAL